MAVTPNQGIYYPLSTDNPDVPGDMHALALDVEKQLIGIYDSIADRNTRAVSPLVGQFAWLKDNNRLTVHVGANVWLQVYPPDIPKFTQSGAIPSNATGANGDVHYKI